MDVQTARHMSETKSRASRLLKGLIEESRGRTVFLEHEVKNLLRETGLPVPRGRFLAAGETVPAKPDLNYPLVVKISSSKIVSKSNVGGVRTGIRNEVELEKALQEMSRIEEAEGFLIEEMAPEGIEVIIGGVIDPQFGPIVMFGLGGVFVELFKDVAFGLAPLKPEDSLLLIRQVKGYKLLEGYRGKPAADIDTLVNIIAVVSEVIASGLVSEIDLNPVSLYHRGAMVLDAKMRLIR